MVDRTKTKRKGVQQGLLTVDVWSGIKTGVQQSHLTSRKLKGGVRCGFDAWCSI